MTFVSAVNTCDVVISPSSMSCTNIFLSSTLHRFRTSEPMLIGFNISADSRRSAMYLALSSSVSMRIASMIPRGMISKMTY